MTIAINGFLADFQAGAGILCIILQAVEWEMTPNEANYASISIMQQSL